jgi:tRNA-dihydrouridine synthase B
MAGVTDVVFRTLCKELGADVMVTEFVSSEGIIRKDERTRKYTEFTERMGVHPRAGRSRAARS